MLSFRRKRTALHKKYNYAYTHSAYPVPDLRLVPTSDADHPWSVEHRKNELAPFRDIGKASAYLAFIRGDSIAPKVFR
jgi:hypothetical protein